MAAQKNANAFITADALMCALQISDSADAGDAMDKLYICVDAEAMLPTSVIATDLRSALKVQLLPEVGCRTIVFEADACEVNRIIEGCLDSEVELLLNTPNTIVFAGKHVECVEARLPVLRLFQYRDKAHQKQVRPDVDLSSIRNEGYVMFSERGIGWFDATPTGLGCLDLKEVAPIEVYNDPTFDKTTVVDASRLSRALSCFNAVYAINAPGGLAPVRLFGVSWRNLVEAAIMPVRVCEY